MVIVETKQSLIIISKQLYVIAMRKNSFEQVETCKKRRRKIFCIQLLNLIIQMALVNFDLGIHGFDHSLTKKQSKTKNKEAKTEF